MKIYAITLLLSFAMIACRQPQRSGGPCSYEEFNTYGIVVSVDELGDSYSVRVQLKGRSIESRSTIDLDDVMRDGVTASVIETYDIAAGQTLFFYVKQIVEGTCVPLYVVLLEEDYRGE